MVQFSGCVSSDDLTVPCRVRHSPLATNKEFNEPEDVICAMRIVELPRQQQQYHSERMTTATTAATSTLNKIGKNMTKSRSFGSPAAILDRSHFHQQQQPQTEAELVLTPIHTAPMRIVTSNDLGNPVQMSQRFASFGSSIAAGGGEMNGRPIGGALTPGGVRINRNTVVANSCSTPLNNINNGNSSDCSRQNRRLGEVTIPLADIMVVDMYGQGDSHCTNITTMSLGFFEFTMENRNGQEVLLAFLKASLPEERVMGGPIPRSPSEFSTNTANTSKSFDVEAFTASRMAERMQRESFSERFRRKMGRMISSIEEVTTSIADCACNCGTNNSISPAPQVIQTTEKRDSPPRQLQHGDGTTSGIGGGGHREKDTVEFAVHPTPDPHRPVTDISKFSTKNRREMLARCTIPSGLSVEEDAEVDTAY